MVIVYGNSITVCKKVIKIIIHNVYYTQWIIRVFDSEWVYRSLRLFKNLKLRYTSLMYNVQCTLYVIYIAVYY